VRGKARRDPTRIYFLPRGTFPPPPPTTWTPSSALPDVEILDTQLLGD